MKNITMRSVNLRLAPKTSRRASHMRKVRATTTPMTSTSLETFIVLPSSGTVSETPTMKSCIPCQVAYPESTSSISEATPIRVLRPST